MSLENGGIPQFDLEWDIRELRHPGRRKSSGPDCKEWDPGFRFFLFGFTTHDSLASKRRVPCVSARARVNEKYLACYHVVWALVFPCATRRNLLSPKDRRTSMTLTNFPKHWTRVSGLRWRWVKNRYPTWNSGKCKHGLTPAVPCTQNQLVLREPNSGSQRTSRRIRLKQTVRERGHD